MSAGDSPGRPIPARPASAYPTATTAVPAPGPVTESSNPVAGSSGDGVPGPSRRRPPVRIGRSPRRARLVVRYLDPWTVLKLSFVVSLVVLVIAVVATAIIYAVLAQMGVWDSLNDLVHNAADQDTGLLNRPFTGPHVVGVAAIVGGVNVILFTALATLASFVYNLVADTVGGIEVTMGEPE